MFLLYLLLAVVLMAGLSVFLTRMTVQMMGKLGGETIHKLHESAEFILNTGKVPPFWREKTERRLKKALSEKVSSSRIAKLERPVRRRYLRQMKKLLQFAENSSTVSDEETREILTAGLKKARKTWLATSLSEMTGE